MSAADGDDLLGEHVERVPRDDRLLDRAGLHPLDDDGRLEQVGPVLREDPAARDGAELVARTPDALEAAATDFGDSTWIDEVDRAHVDAELERRRGDEARDLALLEQLLDLEPLLAGERAVVRAGDLDPLSSSTSSFASSFSRSAIRSASRRLLTKTIVERCCRTSSRISG